MLTISYCAITNRGRIREKNEDNFCAAGLTPSAGTSTEAESVMQGTLRKGKDCALFAVCDGLGGMNAGEVASRLAAEELCKQTDYISHMSAAECTHYLDGCLSEMNERMYALSKTQIGLNGMGTTFVGLCIAGQEAAVLNVGDSRCYFMREGILRRLTTDHSEAERRIRMGLMTPEQARGSKERSMLYRYIGTPPEAGKLECGVYPAFHLQSGDRFLLCSDGLTDMVEESRIASILAAAKTPLDAARALIDTALQNGGKDNVTVILAEVKNQLGFRAGRPASGGSANSQKPAWRKIALLLAVAGVAAAGLYLTLKFAVLRPAGPLQSTAAPTATSTAADGQAGSEAIVFGDDNLESAIREQIGIPNDEITAKDVSAITDLDLQGENIVNIHALKYFSNLEKLNISRNNIRDIGALAGLTHLVKLDISHNNISEIAAVAGLIRLTELYGSYNRISEVESLSQLPNLTRLDLSYNYIRMIDGLAALTALTWLKLDNNNISSIEALAGLQNLQALFLDGNSIQDFGPVKEYCDTLFEKDFVCAEQ